MDSAAVFDYTKADWEGLDNLSTRLSKLWLAHGTGTGRCRAYLDYHQTCCYICNEAFHPQNEIEVISTTEMAFCRTSSPIQMFENIAQKI